MSHFTKIKTQIKDFEILKKTLEKIGKNVRVGKHNISGYGSQSKDVDISCEVSGTFANTRIGFVKGEGEVYEMVSDWYSNKSAQSKFETSLNQTYARELTVDELSKKLYGGYDLNEWVDEDGSLQIEVNYVG